MKHIALVCKLMPLYRLAVFHELSKKNEQYEFTCLGDIKQEGGIKIIPWSMANNVNSGGINWVKTSNYFYVSERLLWQTGIIKRIFFSKYKYFIFEGAVFHLPTWLFAILCRVAGKKVLFWTHGFMGLDKGIKKIIRVCYFKLAHGLLLYGNRSKELMKIDGFDEKKLFVVYNSIQTIKIFDSLSNLDPHIILQKKEKIFCNAKLPTVIFIGRLVKSKNIPFLLKAVKDFSDQSQPINCIIIGDGPEKELIKTFITINQLENNFFLTGSIYDENEIYKYFEISDLMVSPGNVGLNCIHSLAYGVPVLTHNNLKFHGPEVEAIEPGVTGLLFEYDNYSDFKLKITDWLGNDYDKVSIKNKCYKIIKSRYNPTDQAINIKNAIDYI